MAPACVAFKVRLSPLHNGFPVAISRSVPKSFSDIKLPALKKIPESKRAFPSSAITNFIWYKVPGVTTDCAVKILVCPS